MDDPVNAPKEEEKNTPNSESKVLGKRLRPEVKPQALADNESADLDIDLPELLSPAFWKRIDDAKDRIETH